MTSLDHVNDLGWTALIEAEVDPDIADAGGVTALLYAERRGFGTT